jgi:16S rRNA G966 N2-methylase RsmD/transcriptional regulator with XRE-family HTH domain
MTFMQGDAGTILHEDTATDSIDLILTDPPYGIEFMGKDWDKALVHTETWKECFRVLKQGKLAFIMCSPRQDVLSRMIVNLQDAGFRTNYTSIYWTFASGFPKAANISKLLDKKNGRTQETFKPFGQYLKEKRTEKNLSMREIDERLGTNTAYSWWEGRAAGVQLPTKHYYLQLKVMLDLDDRFDDLIEREEAQREIIGTRKQAVIGFKDGRKYGEINDTKPATEEAKKMEGAYVGFQPKPAVEVILVVSKGKTLTWLDDIRIPYQSEDDKGAGWHKEDYGFGYREWSQRHGYDKVKKELERGEPPNEKGRFPANLLVSDDVLNNGHNYKVGDIDQIKEPRQFCTRDRYSRYTKQGDDGSYSRYFSLDSWAKTFPFLIVPKASKGERNKGCEDLPLREGYYGDGRGNSLECFGSHPNPVKHGGPRQNHHPTVKPLKLMSYLITMGSREGDLILDPFCGSGTTCIAAEQLHRRWIGIEMNTDYIEICKKRIAPLLQQLKLI